MIRSEQRPGAPGGRVLFIVAAVVIVIALAAQGRRWHDRLEAAALVRRVEQRTQAALARGRAPSTMFAEHLAWLETAGRKAPADVTVPIAIGAQYLLLRRPADAIAAYDTAARLEPRPEIDLNRGRALWMQGDRVRAGAAFARAVRLNPGLAVEVPADAQPLSRP